MREVESGHDEALKPFLEHLSDLRRTLLHSGLAFVVALAICLPFSPGLLRLLARPLADVDRALPFLRSLQPAGAIALALRLSFWGALVLALPLILFFTARFVFPGLTARERQFVRRTFVLGGGLFTAGAWLAYVVVLPMAVALMLRSHAWMGIRAEWTIEGYVLFAIHLLLGFGIAFELPVVVLLLGWLGLVNVPMLTRLRRHMVVGVLVVGMLLTPPDPGTQLLMAVPLYGLYELSIILLRLSRPRSRPLSEREEPS